MRNTLTLAIALVFSMVLAICDSSRAVPLTGGTGPGGFVEADATTALNLWLKADAISATSGSTISSWVDSSGTAGVSTSTASLDPTFNTGVAGLNTTSGFDAAVEFSDSDRLNLAGITSFLTGSIFGVAAPNNDRYLLQHSSNRQIRMRQSDGQNISAYNGGNNPVSSATSTAAGSFLIGEWLGDPTDGIAFFENGAARGTGVLSAGGTGLSDLGYNRIGIPGGSTDSADIAEIAAFTTRLNSPERQIVENHLSAKYDIAMLTNNRYSGDDAPIHFDRDVFGIGADNPGTGLEFVTNAGAAGFGYEAISGLDEDDFLLAGHNLATNSELAERWARTWYLDNQLSGEEVLDLAFDWSDAGLGTANPLFRGLQYSATAGGPFEPIDSGTLVGDTVTFSGLLASDLPTGFYTLGLPAVPEPSGFLLLGLGAIALMGHTRRGTRKS